MADSVAGPAAGPDRVVGVALAAGEGRRLRPLTRLTPKPLCPVGNVVLLDAALARLRAAIGDDGRLAVNVHHGRAQIEAHLAAAPSVHVSVEEPEALGTAGALGRLRPWIDGRAALVVNADTWCPAELAPLLAGWDGARVRIMVAGDEPFGPRSLVVASLLPWAELSRFEAVPSGLYERCWRDVAARGRVETISYDGAFVDCGTPASYLAANLAAVRAPAPGGRGEPGDRGEAPSIVAPTASVEGGGRVERSVVGAGAVVRGVVRDSVVWPGAQVGPHEVLERAIRTARSMTILVR
jgi:NDP-sugar pyrophosphorylase family protein